MLVYLAESQDEPHRLWIFLSQVLGYDRQVVGVGVGRKYLGNLWWWWCVTQRVVWRWCVTQRVVEVVKQTVTSYQDLQAAVGSSRHAQVQNLCKAM